MHKYSKKDKFLLAVCTIFYLLCLLSLVMFNRIAILLFLILHSSLLLYFYYLQSICDTESAWEDTQEREALHVQHEEDLQQLGELQDRLQLLNTTIATQKTQLETLTRDKLDLEAELTLEKTSHETSMATSANMFLPDAEQSVNDYAPIDIIAIARDSIDELSSYAKKENIQVQISSSSESILVKADKTRIRILFRNIIDNSIKYMQRAGSLVITISNVGTDIFIVCKDNGSGLAEEETEHIFELNYQGSNRISGNGLGLTQAKSIVNSYGGTIYAKSTLGKGMAIYIQLPMD
ncbi:MAG: HAMP domain-containing sensor histidine kinase [Lachnospiraceae bacterium]|nr:HAMP domain-containing sensor histidine kinase [Lachnospiraceae bacterium]